jgi:hypothetical protein
MQLAQFVPGIIKMLTGSDKAEDVATHVVGIAKAVTGTDDGEQALAVIKADPAKLMDFQLAVQEQEQRMIQMFLTDTQDARKRDMAFVQAGITNHRANALAAGAGVLVIFCLFIVVWASGMDDFAKATITLILGRALGWVEQIFSFEFGTTRANKTKDDTINNLTK